MAKNEKETVVEKTTEKPKVVEKTTEDKIKVKKKPKVKKFDKTPEIVKVDLNKPVEKTEDVTKVDLSNQEEKPIVEVVKEPIVETENKTTEETPTLEEITDENPNIEQVSNVIEKEIIESVEKGQGIPENVKKLMDFMEDTGGDLNDYVNLNRDYSDMDNHTLLKEYYKQTKSHLDNDEIDFLMEDQFSYDEDTDEQSDINNFVKKFLNEKSEMEDASGYHKSLFTAMNPDAVAKHFYEQGKADALKNSIEKSKNVSMDPRQEHAENVGSNSGIKVRVLGESSDDFKFKIRKRKQ